MSGDLYKIQGENSFGETEEFNCVSLSESHALFLAARFGLQNPVVLSREKVHPSETREAALASAQDNPILGHDWVPLIQTLDSLHSKYQAIGEFCSASTLAARSGFSQAESPYIQWMTVEEGAIHMELAGNLSLLPPLGPDKLRYLQQLGWTIPGDDPQFPDSELVQEECPNPFQVFDYRKPFAQVFAKTIETLILVYELEIEDFWVFAHPFELDDVLQLNLLIRPYGDSNNADKVFQLPSGASRFRERALCKRLESMGLLNAGQFVSHLIQEFASSAGGISAQESLKRIRGALSDETDLRNFFEHKLGVKLNDPWETDFEPRYFAIVDKDKPRSVLAIFAVVGEKTNSNEPMAYDRHNRQWRRNPALLAQLRSKTPPPVVKLSGDELRSVLEQADGAWKKSSNLSRKAITDFQPNELDELASKFAKTLHASILRFEIW